MTSTQEFMVWPEGSRPPRLVRQVVAKTWHRVFEDRILGLAAEAGFWALLSLPSLLLAIFGLLGYFNGVLGHDNVLKIHDDVLRVAADVVTKGTVNSTVAPLVDQILARGHLEVVSIGFVISLWSGSTVMSDYVNVITVAYDMRGLRGALRSRVVALGLYLGAVVTGLVLLPALALGPDIIISLLPGSLEGDATVIVHVLYWPVVGLGSVAVLATMYMLCLPVRVRWRRGIPGALVAMTAWLVGSFAVRAYLESSFRTKSVYGSLAAPIAALLFFYVTALAVLIGAELNSAIDAVWPVPSTASGRAQSVRKARARSAGDGSTRPIGLGDPSIGDTWGDLPGDAGTRIG
ncbi:MAG: YihY/virulence factor BrkB family protein [Actinomycetota bacterium]|nr:YihY/virulence factor BrkB family protein [Actinomycetota bacterium]